MTDFVSSAVTVSAPATSANLGAGFDTFGLALGLYDEVEAAVAGSGLVVEVEGEGAAAVSRDESHLVVRAMRAAFDVLDAAQPGLRVSCRNTLPHGRGLGSSSSAIVSGIRLAEALVDGAEFSDDDALRLATELEGHPDNVAACLFGGFTIAWSDAHGPHMARLDPHLAVRPVVLIAPTELSTQVARNLLPKQVSHGDASANAGRAALMTAAVTTRPDLLLAATEDRLHQRYRGPAMPESLDLVERLRADGHAATVSGAGPTVIVLSTPAEPLVGDDWTPDGWTALSLDVDLVGAQVRGVTGE